MARFWSAPKLYPGRTFVLVGGGPSLKDIELSAVQGRAVTITVNNAINLAPWSDFHFFGDRRWWRWHRDDISAAYAGRIITASCASDFGDGRVLRMDKAYEGFSHEPHRVFGIDSGMMAMNLAYLLGAKKIILLGYDMSFAPDGESHWHPDHEVPSVLRNYVEKFAPQYPEAVKELTRLGVEVVCATPSAMTFIPQVDLEAALEPVDA